VAVRVSKVCSRPEPISKALTPEQRRRAEELLQLAERQGVKIRAGYERTLDAIRDEIDLEQLRAAIANGQVNQAQGIVDSAIASVGGGVIGGAIRAAVQAGGDMAAREATEFLGTRLEVVFNVTNPRVAEFLQRYEMGLIRNLTNDVRQVVRDVLGQAIVAGRNPIDSAREVKRAIGLLPRQEAAVRNYRRLLEERSAEALQRALRDKRFDRTVRRAVQTDEALTAEQIDRMVERYRERFLKYRAETIARTESMRALSAGALENWRELVRDGKVDESQVRRFWVYTHDSKVRPWHASIPSMNPQGVGLEEAFETEKGPLLYPHDPNGAAREHDQLPLHDAHSLRAHAREGLRSEPAARAARDPPRAASGRGSRSRARTSTPRARSAKCTSRSRPARGYGPSGTRAARSPVTPRSDPTTRARSWTWCK
jgi:hypothetical protein